MRFAAAAGACVLLGLAAFSTGACADEEKIPLKDVPKAVLDAVKARFPKGEIKSAEKEDEDGKTTYEVALKDDGHTLDVALKADGTILEIEKKVAAKDLPKAVAAAVEAKYPKGTVKKAEEIVTFKKGKEQKSFEVVVTETGKKSVEVKLSADGKILKQEEDDDDDEDDD
ncbi:PepSY domain-containing protein [Paludisphaera borealis]|uniref:Putative beta-lactamase-inhibitor-like PepSY-like domain-containing protein n=1 Tax=Paludisphaera borealis TaxID=1387353 RepID=A0A1U7CXR7_9BACT|nr:PepSY-like domain-containing protein [Paludisphaera borealis]APW63688.1 hypothetical protein BSF38_05262 [Paludisphaera borealis]